jgi:predicted PolB exonuclease-like 3'-5' exonuclease
LIYLLNSIIAFRQKPDPLLAQLAPLVGIRILENNNYQMKQKIYESHRSFLLNYYKDYFDQMVLCVIDDLSLVYEGVYNQYLKYMILMLLEKIINLNNIDIII